LIERAFGQFRNVKVIFFGAAEAVACSTRMNGDGDRFERACGVPAALDACMLTFVQRGRELRPASSIDPQQHVTLAAKKDSCDSYYTIDLYQWQAMGRFVFP